MIDLLYLAHNRLEFTKASLSALIANTNWRMADRLIIYDDASEDGTREYLMYVTTPRQAVLRRGTYGSPVSVMNDYLCGLSPHDTVMFAKIDSDTVVPPGWLDECLRVMAVHPELHFLGIESFNPVQSGRAKRSYTEARYIGGIGLMRAETFVTLPRPNGRFGFTAWQEREASLKKGWIAHSLPVFLLDRLPREPWAGLSKEYVKRGWQREWPPYEESDKPLWSWWCE